MKFLKYAFLAILLFVLGMAADAKPAQAQSMNCNPSCLIVSLVVDCYGSTNYPSLQTGLWYWFETAGTHNIGTWLQYETSGYDPLIGGFRRYKWVNQQMPTGSYQVRWKQAYGPWANQWSSWNGPRTLIQGSGQIFTFNHSETCS